MKDFIKKYGLLCFITLGIVILFVVGIAISPLKSTNSEISTAEGTSLILTSSSSETTHTIEFSTACTTITATTNNSTSFTTNDTSTEFVISTVENKTSIESTSVEKTNITITEIKNTTTQKNTSIDTTGKNESTLSSSRYKNESIPVIQGDFCSFEINCMNLVKNLEKLEINKREFVPQDGVIFRSAVAAFEKDSSVFDLLKRICNENNIHIDSIISPGSQSVYVRGINNLYEKDCGLNSGWMYKVNGDFPMFSCSEYIIQPGDIIEFVYTCNYGDV